MGRKYIIIVWLCLAIVSASYQFGYSQNSAVTLKVTPADIKTDLFYNGTVLDISAQFPSCDGVAIKFEGKSETIELNKKGKVGPLWMNVAQMTVSDAPQTYIYSASDKLEKLGSNDELEKIGLGYKSLRKRVSFSVNKPLDGFEFEQFIKLEENFGLYGSSVGSKIRPEDALNGNLSTTLSIPSIIPSGRFKLYLYCFKDGHVIGQAASEITIEKAGLPHFMSSLAFNRSALYGVIAIVFAMLIGILMGVAFSFLGKGSH